MARGTLGGGGGVIEKIVVRLDFELMMIKSVNHSLREFELQDYFLGQ